MLERISVFVLEVLPYVLTTIIVAVLIPGFVYSQFHGTSTVATPNLAASSESIVAVTQRPLYR